MKPIFKKNVLFVSGIPDDDRIQVHRTHPRGTIVTYENTGTCDFFSVLTPPDWNKLPAVLDSRQFPLHFDPATHCIINEIAEPDSHGKTLDYLQQLLERVPHIPVINAPHLIKMTRRDRVYEALQGIPGLLVPHTVRFYPRHLKDILACMDTHQMTYPLILKTAGKHGGKDTLRFDTLEQLIDGLYALPLDGRPYYLIAYHDTSHQGVFAKYRVMLIDGHPYPCHLRFSEHWMVHYYSAERLMQQHPAYYTQEAEFVDHFFSKMPSTFLQVVNAIHQRIPIDYTGMDFGINAKGQIVLFELNANMLVLRVDPDDLPHFFKSVDDMKAAVHQMVNRRLQSQPRHA